MLCWQIFRGCRPRAPNRQLCHRVVAVLRITKTFRFAIRFAASRKSTYFSKCPSVSVDSIVCLRDVDAEHSQLYYLVGRPTCRPMCRQPKTTNWCVCVCLRSRPLTTQPIAQITACPYLARVRDICLQTFSNIVKHFTNTGHIVIFVVVR